MKTKSLILGCLLAFTSTKGYCQGTTFIYDQQSADETSTLERPANAIQSNEPIGQSFTPLLTSVGFVRFIMGDEHGGNGQGATVVVNLISGSITGTVIGTSQPVTMPDNFGLGTDNAGYVNFFFSTPVSVTPGTTYYFVPVVQSGDLWGISGSMLYNYPGGQEYFSGVPGSQFDLWFREGLVVPEPSTWALLILSGGALFFRRRKAA